MAAPRPSDGVSREGVGGPHVALGRVHELEVSAGDGVPVPLADVPDPTDVTVG